LDARAAVVGLVEDDGGLGRDVTRFCHVMTSEIGARW
jgi:hypothetical protein